MFADTRKATEELRQLAEQGIEARRQIGRLTEQDEVEIATHTRQARQELTGESERDITLKSATEIADKLKEKDSELSDSIYEALAETYGTAGDVDRGLATIDQIEDHVSRIEGLIRLAKVTRSDRVHDEIKHSAMNEEGKAVNIDVAKKVYLKLRVEENLAERADSFAMLVGDAAEKDPNYADVANAREVVERETRVPPKAPSTSLETQARIRAQAAHRTTGLAALDEYRAQAARLGPGRAQDLMFTVYTLATLELARKQHPETDKAAA